MVHKKEGHSESPTDSLIITEFAEKSFLIACSLFCLGGWSMVDCNI